MTHATLRGALTWFVYETTCLSPLNNDGSHDCRISAECLENGRQALKSDGFKGWTCAELEEWAQGWSRNPHTTLKAFIDAGLCSDREPAREETRLRM